MEIAFIPLLKIIVWLVFFVVGIFVTIALGQLSLFLMYFRDKTWVFCLAAISLIWFILISLMPFSITLGSG